MEVRVEEAVSLTLNEAGYVVGRSRAAINRAVDRGLIKVKLQRRGKAQVREVGSAELRFLALAGEMEKDLTPSARRKIYEAIRRLPAGTPRLDLGVMELKLADVDRRIDERLRRLEKVKTHVDETATEPVLRGTTIRVHIIAALARGQSVAEIVEDYPDLSPDKVEAAVEYAKVYPRTGRPLPTRSVKRMLADMATVGAWDLEGDLDHVEPHLVP